jgi:hypothetical protein
MNDYSNEVRRPVSPATQKRASASA